MPGRDVWLRVAGGRERVADERVKPGVVSHRCRPDGGHPFWVMLDSLGAAKLNATDRDSGRLELRRKRGTWTGRKVAEDT